jgi:hypothetical protein
MPGLLLLLLLRGPPHLFSAGSGREGGRYVWVDGWMDIWMGVWVCECVGVYGRSVGRSVGQSSPRNMQADEMGGCARWDGVGGCMDVWMYGRIDGRR